jgi:hypothetical protein
MRIVWQTLEDDVILPTNINSISFPAPFTYPNLTNDGLG